MRLRRALVLCAVGLAVIAAGCGGSSSDSSDDDGATAAAATTAEASEAVPANEWAAAVCRALTSWQSEITSGTPDLADVQDLEATKQAVADYLDSVSTATGSLVEDVEAAGVPDVDEGESIAADFESALSSVQQSFEDAKTQVEGLSTADPGAFATELQEVGTTLQSAGTEATSVFDGLSVQYPALNDAIDSEPACSSL